MNKEDFCKRMRISETEFDIKRNGDFEIEDMERSYNFGKEDGIYACCRDGYLAGAEPREKRIAELENENAELKEVHESDKRSLALIAKKGADFEKAYNEAEELLDKQIEATYKLFEENKELKRQVEQKQHLADVRLEQSIESYKLFSDERKARIDVDIAHDNTTDQLTYAKTIIQDLLDNTDEYARQKAEDFLKESEQF